MVSRWVLRLAILIGVFTFGPTGWAGVDVTSANTRWERAEKLTITDEPAEFFGTLGSTGDARFFTLQTDAVGQLAVTLDVPVWADPKFHPQVVVYQPDTMTVGPSLPMAQPPDTIALVYPLSGKTKRFEGLTQINIVERLSTTIELPVVGQYYLAVYNADRAGGRFRLTLADPSVDGRMALWSWPKRWWISQTWASSSSAVAYLPLVLLGAMIVVTWLVTRSRRPTIQIKKT